MDVKIGDYLQRARWDANKSQEYMADKMKIARKTVQNWEKGTSEPTISQTKEWFKVLHLNPMPYILQYFYQDTYSKERSEAERKKILIEMLKETPTRTIEQFLYTMQGEHGSSSRALLQLMIAHIQCPMRDRYDHAALTFEDYKIAKEMGELTDPNAVQPDEEFLERAISEGRKAIITGTNEYSMI